MIYGRGPAGPRPVRTVREFTNSDRVEVQPGEPFLVVLSDNGPGGYLWRAAELPQAIRLRREDDLAPGEGAPGATGVRSSSRLAELTSTGVLFARRLTGRSTASRFAIGV